MTTAEDIDRQARRHVYWRALRDICRELRRPYNPPLWLAKLERQLVDCYRIWRAAYDATKGET